MRTFISVELPDEIKVKIGKSISGLKRIDSGIKWVEDLNLHVTLKFLGWVEDCDLNCLFETVEDAVKGIGSFKMRIEGSGSFPEGSTPRVFWLGITKGGEQLKGIADDLERGLSKAGIRSEEREFSAHLTIGRVKGKKGVDKVKEEMEKFKRSDFGEFTVDRINIMKSTPTPKGPVYEVYKSINLIKEEKS